MKKAIKLVTRSPEFLSTLALGTARGGMQISNPPPPPTQTPQTKVPTK
jgi:hypothetical protein